MATTVRSLLAAGLAVPLLWAAATAPASADATAGWRTGVLAGGPGAAPGAITGVDYTGPGGVHGVTGADGSFRYRGNWPVRFGVGQVELGHAKGAQLVTPFQLSGGAQCTIDEALTRELVFLEAVDGDRDPDNGISISAQTRARAAGVGPVRVSDLDDAALTSLVRTVTGDATATLPDAAAVLARFRDQVDGEQWTEKSVQEFTGPADEMRQIYDMNEAGQTPPVDMLNRQEGLLRSQGVATDGRSYVFSWQYGLTRTMTDARQTVLTRNTLAIPPQIAAYGGNHIGDIDYHDGKIYAPIEDGDKPKGEIEYLHPFIAVYDAKTLRFTGEYHELPQNLHTQGVPWVSVDAARGVFYTAEWDDTKVLNVFDLHTFTLIRTVPLSQTLRRIQGAKVYHGMLYAFADIGASLPLYKIDPESGHVITVHHVDISSSAGEGEGLVFLPRPDGTLLHTLDIAPDEVTTNFRNLALTKPSLRDQVCFS
ncbi:hypothetical protein [Microbispora sp. NPDC046933]|uniref:hypothetical protein n=1 Tax=Microbispora sp. NPDC046933 TaxID=3155618 RepID=UPI0034018E91